TPLHRDGSLPNTFKWALQFPFIVPQNANFTEYTYNTQNTWYLISSSSYRGSGTSYVENLITVFNAGYSIQSVPQDLEFITSSPNERVFVLISGHIQLELRSDVQVSID